MDGIDAAGGSARHGSRSSASAASGRSMSQLLLARGVDVSIIDTDVEMIRKRRGVRPQGHFFGDGTRLDVLRTSGAAEAPRHCGLRR